MSLGFEVHLLDCASVAFILLCWLFNVKKKKKENKNEEKEKKEKEKEEKSYPHLIFTSLVFEIRMVCQRYYGLIIRGHFGLRDLFFFYKAGESIV